MAAPISINLFFDTIELVRTFNVSVSSRNEFLAKLKNPDSLYNNRPIKDYIYLITKVSPEYKSILQRGLTPEHIKDLLNDFYQNKHGYSELIKEYNALRSGEVNKPSFLTKEEHEEVIKKEEAKKRADESEKKGAAQAKHDYNPLVSGIAKIRVEDPKQERQFTAATNKDKGLSDSEVIKIAAKGAANKLPKIQLPLFLELPLFRLIRKIPIPTAIMASFGTVIGSLLSGTQGAAIGFIGGATVGQLANKYITKDRPEEENGYFDEGYYGGDEEGQGFSEGGRGARGNSPLRAINSRLPLNKVLPGARGIATKAAARGIIAFLGGPEIAIVLVVFIVLILLLLLIGFFSSSTLFRPNQGNLTTSSDSGKLTIKKTGPEAVQNGEDITYEISVNYNGAGTASAELSDKLPQNTAFKSASDGGIESGGMIKWKLTDLIPNQPKKISLTLTPNQSDTWVINEARSDLLETITPKTSSTSGTSVPRPTIDPGTVANITDFDTLMRAQGRNVGVMGDESSFVQKVVQNGFSYGLAGREEYIRKIYRGAIARNVNPLVIMTTWGTESLYKLSGESASGTLIKYELGCDPHLKRYIGFDRQIECAANTWNNRMNDFEKDKDAGGVINLPSKIGKTCSYNDSFIYAAEKYAPVCVIIENKNQNWRPNFVKIYKKFLGV